MTMQRKFWSDTGQTSDDGGTLPRFLPTPYATMATKWKMKPGNQSSDRNMESLCRRGKLTSYAVVSLARTSATQDEEQGSKVKDLDYFTKPLESFSFWNHDTLSWKTSQRSLLEDWTSYSGRWPRSGIVLSGRICQLLHSEHHTSETEYS